MKKEIKEEFAPHGLPTFCRIDDMAKDRGRCHICEMRVWSEAVGQLVQRQAKVNVTCFQKELGTIIQRELQKEEESKEIEEGPTKEGILAVWTTKGQRKLIKTKELKLTALKHIEDQPGWIAVPIEKGGEGEEEGRVETVPYMLVSRLTADTMTGLPKMQKY